MQLNIEIDIDEIANEEAESIINRIGANKSVDKVGQKLLVEQIKNQFSDDQDELKRLVEYLLIKEVDKTMTGYISTAKQFTKIFGGNNND